MSYCASTVPLTALRKTSQLSGKVVKVLSESERGPGKWVGSRKSVNLSTAGKASLTQASKLWDGPTCRSQSFDYKVKSGRISISSSLACHGSRSPVMCTALPVVLVEQLQSQR